LEETKHFHRWRQEQVAKIVHCGDGHPQAREFSDDGPFDEGLRQVPKGFTSGSSIVAKGGSKAAKRDKEKEGHILQKP
jgi:hypothetical protein